MLYYILWDKPQEIFHAEVPAAERMLGVLAVAAVATTSTVAWCCCGSSYPINSTYWCMNQETGSSEKFKMAGHLL